MVKHLSSVVQFTDLGIADELNNKEFRDQFFRAEREIDIPAQIKGLRKFRGMTQKELAESVGTKQSAISRIEKAQETNWELETLVRLAEEMGAQLRVIFEPYEVVAARYRAAARSPESSAATAGTPSPQPSHVVPPSNEQAPRQDRLPAPTLAKKEGDPRWN